MEILQCEIVASFLRDFEPGREQCWIAERGGTMVGSVLLVDGGDGVAKLRLLYVEPWARGLGIGQALVQQCIHFAREAGYARMSLWTHSVLASARRIYEAAGMRIVKTETHGAFGKPERGEIWEMALQA
jgi:GNAT superfamily N-acetyltransferase